MGKVLDLDCSDQGSGDCHMPILQITRVGHLTSEGMSECVYIMTSRGCMCAWKDDRRLQRHKGSGKGPNKGCRNSAGPKSFGPTVIWGPKWITTHLCMSQCAHSRGIY